MNNMADLFGKINEFQSKMREVKETLEKSEVSAEAGGGMVKVTANGSREIISIKVDPDILKAEEAEMVEDLIVAGVNKALKAADELSQEKMSEVTKGVIPPGGIPGFDMSKFGL